MAKKNVAENGPKKQGWFDRVCDIYAQQARLVGGVYSIGAAIVIIGAMFKILHLPGAGALLGAGMVTEAVLFIMGLFEKPHPTYHWENRFPELIQEHGEHTPVAPAEGHAAQPVAGQQVVAGGAVGGAHIPGAVANVDALSEEEVKSLKTGIANLGKAASQLSQLSEVATATNGLVEKMNVAGQAAQAYAGTQANLATASDLLAKNYQAVQAGMEAVNGQTKAYAQGVANINAQLASLNSVYEIQLKQIQAQAQACGAQTAVYNAQTEKLNHITATVEAINAQTQQLQQVSAASVQIGAQFVAGQKKLAEQVAELNKVYGNMLNAL